MPANSRWDLIQRLKSYGRIFSGLGDSCQNHTQCVAGGSQSNVRCENGRCSCNPDFVQDQDNCRGNTLQS